MTVRRVQVSALAPTMTVDARTVRHLQVLRLREGDAVQVFDGQGHEAEARIDALDDHHAILVLGEVVAATAETPFPLVLAVALLKGDKLADVVRAATELGVSGIQLLVTAHADAREIGEQKLQRLRRIAGEASKQSKRAVVPQVLSPTGLEALRWDGQLFVAQPGSAERLADRVDWTGPVTVLTGPEGGLTESEVTALTARGAVPVTLGPRILRAETAPVALLGAIAALGR